MKRQPYFPRIISQRPEWFGNYANELTLANAVLALPAADVAASVADARFCSYACGAWLTAVRDFGPAATASIDVLFEGAGAAPHELTVFTAPALPAGPPPVVAVAPGALLRIYNYVKTIKASPNYTEAIGLQLGIVGAEQTIDNPLPTFTLEVERNGACECVRIVFKKYGRQGVVIYSRRGGGAWELLAIDLASPYQDERDLLVPGTPEVREYRLQYYEDSAAIGGFTDVQSVTVTP